MKLDALLATFMPVPAELRLRPPEVTLVTDDSRKVVPGGSQLLQSTARCTPS
jgi:hypothetical protein